MLAFTVVANETTMISRVLKGPIHPSAEVSKTVNV
jgi:hypothetical protein